MANKLKFSLEDVLLEAKRAMRRTNNDERITTGIGFFTNYAIFFKIFQFREGNKRMNLYTSWRKLGENLKKFLGKYWECSRSIIINKLQKKLTFAVCVYMARPESQYLNRMTQKVFQKSCHWLSQNHLICVVPRGMYTSQRTCRHEATWKRR